MNPATYEEKIAQYTAIQWDGTQESVDWILANLSGATQHDGLNIAIRDSLDRDQELPRGSWVVRNDASKIVFTMDEDAFAARFETAG